MLANLILLLYLWLFSCSCYSQDISNNELSKIDVLTNIQKVNDNTILIKFGADAVAAIKSQKGIIVIDAGISTGLTARYRQIIENKFQRNDFAYVVNTHGHHDHNRGNNIFEEAEIIGHVNSLREISVQWKDPEKIAKSIYNIVNEYELKLKAAEPDPQEWNYNFTEKMRCLYSYYDAKFFIPVKPPDLTFSDSLTIAVGDVTLDMIYFGKCHSDSDILIYVPQLKILFTGDLFFKYGMPSMNDKLMTDKAKWLKAVKWTERRIINIDKIITGHGQILSVEDLKSFNNKILTKISEE